MVTRWKKRLSLLALVLGVDLLLVGLAGAVFAGAVLLPGGYSPQDAFQADYQNTALFRREIEDQLESGGWPGAPTRAVGTPWKRRAAICSASS